MSWFVFFFQGLGTWVFNLYVFKFSGWMSWVLGGIVFLQEKPRKLGFSSLGPLVKSHDDIFTVNSQGFVTAWPTICLYPLHEPRKKETPTFHYTSCFIGMIVAVKYKPYLVRSWVVYNPLYTLNNPFFPCSHANTS